MQARYYDPVIGRFYSNDPVDAVGHIGKGNPVHGFNRYTYANNNPYKYTDPDGEFGIIGALIDAGLDFATQVGSAMYSGASFTDAVANVDYGSVAVSGALGSVGMTGTQLLKGAVTGTMKFGGEVVKVTSTAERVAVGVNGATKAGTVGAIQAGRKGEDMTKGAAIKVVDSVTSPVPVGTAIDKGMDYLNGQTQEQVEPPKEPEQH